MIQTLYLQHNINIGGKKEFHSTLYTMNNGTCTTQQKISIQDFNTEIDKT